MIDLQSHTMLELYNSLLANWARHQRFEIRDVL